MNKGQEALDLFNSGYNCAQAVVLAFKEELNIDEEILKSLSSSFGGGISRLREVCGCVSAMALILGKLYGDYDINNVDEKAKHYELIQSVAKKFLEKFNSINCATLLNLTNKIDDPRPSERTKEYYKTRPCGKYIYYMASLIENTINGHE